MSSARGNISPSAWESHKDTILRLYGAQSLKEVRKEMGERHNFHASSSQYQRQFNYWNVRKNRPKHEWKQYFAALDVGSGLTPGELLPVIGRDLQKSSKRARRWVSTPPPPDVPQCTGSTLPATDADRNPILAPIVPVATQNIDQADIQSPFSNVVEVLEASGAPLIHNNTQNGNLFTTGVLQGSSQQTTSGATSDSSLAQWSDLNNIASSTGGAFQTNPNFQSLPSGPDSFDLDLLLPIAFPEGNFTAYTFPSQDVAFKLSLPFASVEQFLPSDRIATGNSFFGAINSGLASRSITAIHPSRNRSIALRPAALQQLSLQKLGSVIPGESFSLITNSQAFETNFVRMLSFSVLNGFAGLNDVPMEDILRFLNRFAGKLFLDILEQCSPHVSRTLSDNVFRAAIEATDAKLVKLLLDRGLVDANETVCFHKSSKCTPIERAAFLGSPDLIRSLIDGKADVDRTHYEDGEHPVLGGGALAMLVYSISWASNQGRLTIQPQLVEVFHQLISAGARARPEFLKFACGNGMRDLFTLLASSMRPESHRTLFRMAPNNGIPMLSQVARVMDDQAATTWFRDTFGHCNQLCNNECLTNGIELLHHVALDAARAGKAGLVKLLVEEGLVDSRDPNLFPAVISSQNYDLVEFILSFGPDLDPPAVNVSSSYQLNYTTPIAEAVRSRNKGLTRMLELGGSLDHLNEGGRFKPLLIAAAEIGDQDFVSKLLRQPIALRLEDWEDRERPHATALVCAALSGHREIVRMLLQGGAAQCRWGITRHSAHCQAVEAAVRHQDMQMMRDLIEFQVQAEYEWNLSCKFDKSSAIQCSFMKTVVEEYPGTQISSEEMQKFLGQCIKTDNLVSFKTLLQTLEADRLLLDDCLETAIESRHLELIEYLLDLGAYPFNRKMLDRIIPDRPDLLRILFKQDRRRQTIPTCIGANALKTVVGDGEGDSEALNLLIETHAINFTRLEQLEHTYLTSGEIEGVVFSGDALTPLGLAILGSPERPGTSMTAMEKFLQAGADPNGIARARGRHSKCPPLTTALVLAVGTSREDAVKMLLRRGAFVDSRPRLGTTRTALQHAAETGNASMVKLLLDHGASGDDTAPACGGATALQFAAMSGNLNIAEDLLTRGSKLGAFPSQIEGRWPLEGAAEAGRLDMISFLWKLYLQSSQFGEPCAGFSDRQCLRSMNFARLNGHIGCVNLISELSGISVDRLEMDNYGETWMTYEPDYS